LLEPELLELESELLKPGSSPGAVGLRSGSRSEPFRDAFKFLFLPFAFVSRSPVTWMTDGLEWDAAMLSPMLSSNSFSWL
jgi:hypothetical protein